MSFVTSGLTAYTKQLTEPMLTSAVLGAKTQQIIMDGGIVIPKAKSVVAIPLIDTDAVFQTQSCSLNASGSTTMTQATITVGKIKVEETLCPKDLESFFLQEAIKQGSLLDESSAPAIYDAFLAKKNARIAAQLETALWVGDTGATGTGSGNLNKFNGLSTYINAGSPVDANVSGFNGATGAITAVTSANIVAATDAIYKAMPAQVASKPDAKIFVGYDWFRLLVIAYRTANFNNFTLVDDKGQQSIILPGTTIEIVPVNGLNGTGDAYGMAVSNMALAVDLEGEEENYQFLYNPYENNVLYRAQWKIAPGVAFTSECVKFVSSI